MKKQIFFYKRLLLIIFSCLFFACTKENYDLPVGKLQGIAKPEGTQIIFDRGDKEFKTTSGVNGAYSIQNLETGIYNIYFKKEGYFNYKKFGFQFLGGPVEINILGQVTLRKNPNADLDLRLISFSDYQRVVISGMVLFKNEENKEQKLSVRWFLNDKSEVSSDNYIETFSSNFELNENLFITDFLLTNNHFSNGSTIYIMGHFCDTNNDYFDWENEKEVLVISNKASNVLEFKLPTNFFND